MLHSPTMDFFYIQKPQPGAKITSEKVELQVACQDEEIFTLNAIVGIDSNYMIPGLFVADEIRILMDWLDLEETKRDENSLLQDHVLLQKHPPTSRTITRLKVENGYFVVQINESFGKQVWIYLFSQREYAAIADQTHILFVHAQREIMRQFTFDKPQVADVPGVRRFSGNVLEYFS